MRKITFKLFFSFILLFSIQQGFSQVSGISYTVSPTAEYVWWQDKAGLDDGLLVGGKLGFGFGQFLELRGSYQQSINLETNFSDFGITNFSEDLFTANSVKLTRWGGEIKANISKKKLVPYLTFGTGVQSIRLEEEATFKQIYLAAGAGIKFSIADRYTLMLGAKNTQFSYNSGKNLLTEENKIALNTLDADFNSEKLRNWSASAALEFYLGGRRPNEMTELDKVYMSSFSNGFRSLQGTLEPMIGKINFSDDLPYRNTNLAGVNLGLDFGQFIGVRAFYWQALEDGKATSFDDLAMYGGEMRFKLNTQGGIIPYLILGGGNIDVKNKYVGETIELTDSTSINLQATDKGFAMGGIGILLPISRTINVFGSARALMTSAGNLEDADAPEDIKTNMMYSAGLRINFGKKPVDPNEIVQQNIDAAMARQQALDDEKRDELKTQYEVKMTELETQLNEAYLAQDAKKAAELTEEKNKTLAEIASIEQEEVQSDIAAAVEAERQKSMNQNMLATEMESNNGNNSSANNNVTADNKNQQPQGEIRMTPAEFQSLVSAILEGMNTTSSSSENINRLENPNNAPAKISNNAPTNSQQNENAGNMTPLQAFTKEQELNRKLEEIQKSILVMQEKVNAQGENMSMEMKKELDASARRLSEEINILEQRIILNGEKYDAIKQQIKSTEQSGTKTKVENNVPTGQN